MQVPQSASLVRRAPTRDTSPSIALLLGLLCAASGLRTASAAPPQPWIATWAASPQAPWVSGPAGSYPNLAGRTIRERMRVTLGGDELRVQLSNVFGTRALRIGHATVGLANGASSVVPGSIQTLTFGGHPSIVVPPGAPVLSDPVPLRIPADADVSISIYCPQTRNLPLTYHATGLRTAIISPPGDFTSRVSVPEASSTTSSLYVTALLVPREPGQATIVAFGDSITDGNRSKVDALRNWPDDFARRLAAAGLRQRIAIVNEGIGGNRLLSDFVGTSALGRFERDVLTVPGARYVIVLEGINDLGFSGARMGAHLLAPTSALPKARDIIAAYRQLIARAHAHGLKIYGATLTPWEGTDLPGYYASFKEPIREAVNHWIRTSGAFDGVIDFDAALRDPKDPHRMRSRYVSSDHLHPNDAGYQKMADVLRLSLFREE